MPFRASAPTRNHSVLIGRRKRHKRYGKRVSKHLASIVSENSVIPDSWDERAIWTALPIVTQTKTVRECRASIERADYLDIRHVAKDIPESWRSQYAACRCLPLTGQRESSRLSRQQKRQRNGGCVIA